MGLDMYLTYDCQVDDHGLVSAFTQGEQKPITINLGQWRKANAIHKWFVDNVQDGNDDCKSYNVSAEQLGRLYAICEGICEKAKEYDVVCDEDDNEKETPKGFAEYCKKVLPTQEGFFFGGTKYDGHYLYNVEKTINIIKGLYEFMEANWQYDYSTQKLRGQLCYQASW